MTILGIGHDLVDIRRIERALERFGARFEERVFTPGERAYARQKQKGGARAIADVYAKRFAAKEACLKALGTGFSRGISWQEIEVINDAEGKPSLRLHGMARAHFNAMSGKKTSRIHLSLTGEYPYASAFAVMEG